MSLELCRVDCVRTVVVQSMAEIECNIDVQLKMIDCKIKSCYTIEKLQLTGSQKLEQNNTNSCNEKMSMVFTIFENANSER